VQNERLGAQAPTVQSIAPNQIAGSISRQSLLKYVPGAATRSEWTGKFTKECANEWWKMNANFACKKQGRMVSCALTSLEHSIFTIGTKGALVGTIDGNGVQARAPQTQFIFAKPMTTTWCPRKIWQEVCFER